MLRRRSMASLGSDSRGSTRSLSPSHLRNSGQDHNTDVSKMLDVQSGPCLLPSSQVISLPLPVSFHRRSRLSSVPLVELGRQLSEEEVSSSGRRRSLSSSFHPETYAFKGGMCSVSDTMESIHQRGGPNSPIAFQPGSVRIKHLTRSQEGSSRFPKLDECAHFHYEHVELGPLKVCLSDEKQEGGGCGGNKSPAFVVPASGADKENEGGWWLCVQITSNTRFWTVRRSYENFRMLDRQLHRCVYDRKYSLLSELPAIERLPTGEEPRQEALRGMLTEYLERFSQLAGSLINCGTVLNWLELDNRGNRLIVTDEAAINTPAVAAAYVVKRYRAQAVDEISFEVGDMVSVIDMPPQDESTWWRGKKGFEVGFFPCECVEVIGDKVPQSLKVPNSSSTSQSSKPVLRKHGKLIAFFRSFLVTRPSRRKLKQSGILKERVFGCDLGELLMNTGRDIPLVLKCCAEFIENHGIVDGIYRLSGITSNIQKLRLAFDEDRAPDLTDEAIIQDIHCVASLLKMYFRELPNPLLTYQLYDKFVAAVQSEDDVRLLRLRDVVQQLPPPHYRTLEYLMCHLARVAAHGQQTGMTPKNVAIVWAPNLLRSKDLEGGGVGALHVVGVQAVLTEYLIRYAEILFNEKMPVFQSPDYGLDTPRRSRPKSLAISTPTKLLSLEEARSRVLSTNLPPSHQKYIDVGPGPDNLPPKYHTIIDLPSGKRSSTKLKKSPSGWKSFFSRTGSREKGTGRKISSPRKITVGSAQFPISPFQVKVGDIDSSRSNPKKLRTVKSAESLVLSAGPSCRNSTNFDLLSPADISKLSWPLYEYSTGMEALSSSYTSPPKSPNLHKHVRSVSHDSYFEQLESGCDNDRNYDDEENAMEEGLRDDDIDCADMRETCAFQLYTEVVEMMHRNEEFKDINLGLMSHSRDSDVKENSYNSSGNDDSYGSDSLSFYPKGTRKQKLHSSDSDVGSPKVQRLSKKFRQSSGSCVDKARVEEKDVSEQMESQSSRIKPRLDDEGGGEDESGLFVNFNKEINSSSFVDSNLEDTKETAYPFDSGSYRNEETVIAEVHAIREPNIDKNMESQNQLTLMVSPRSSCEEEKFAGKQFQPDALGEENELVLSNCGSLEVTASDTLSTSQLRSFEPGNQCVLSENYFIEDRNYLSPTGMDTSLETPDSPTMANISEMPSSSSEDACGSDIDASPIIEQTFASSSQSQMSPLSLAKKEAEGNIETSEDSDNNEGGTSPLSVSDDEAIAHYFNKQIEHSTTKGRVDNDQFDSERSNELDQMKPSVPNYSNDLLSLSSIDVSEEVATRNGSSSRQHANDGLRNSWRKSCIDKASPASPIEESRRKFESEIGRSIVREHQMRLEMEQIQAECQQQKVFQSDSSNRISLVEKQPVGDSNNEQLAQKSKTTFVNGVELRRSVTAPPIPVPPIEREQDKKRNSDPLTALKENIAPIEPKRFSEPTGSSPKYTLGDKKSSVKELLSKFEIPGDKGEMEESEPKSPTLPSPGKRHTVAVVEEEVLIRQKPSQPSLYTQIKVFKLQNLQSPSQSGTPKRDPWSDPILDLMEASDNQKTSQTTLIQQCSAKQKHSLLNEASKSPLTTSISLPCCPTTNLERPQTLNLNKPPKSHRKSESLASQKRDLELNSSSDSPSLTLDDSPKKSLTPVSSPSEEILSQSSCPEETEAMRRERIDRIKEERRAQLREKLRSESFRVEAEEKEKVQNEFRVRKGSCTKLASSPTTDDGGGFDQTRRRSLSPKKGVRQVSESNSNGERSKSSPGTPVTPFPPSDADNPFFKESQKVFERASSQKSQTSEKLSSNSNSPVKNSSLKNTGASIYSIKTKDSRSNSSSSNTPTKKTSSKTLSKTSPKHVEIITKRDSKDSKCSGESSPTSKSFPEKSGTLKNENSVPLKRTSPPIRIRDRAAMFECPQTPNQRSSGQIARH